MKLAFTPSNDGMTHTYCWHCGGETVMQHIVDGLLSNQCSHCGLAHPRALVIDPNINWWVDETGEYWHEAAGVFVGNGAGKFLFFERTRYPFGLTVPAGHTDKGESSHNAATRELHEETGIEKTMSELTHIATDDVVGDSCRRGADAHRWHTYATTVSSPSLRIDEQEGVRPVWLTLDEALTQNPTFVLQYVIQRHARSILRVAG